MLDVDAILAGMNFLLHPRPEMALDIFFEAKGLEGRYPESKAAAIARQTKGGVPYQSLSDEHRLV